MKALVDRLSAELSERYIQYVETFLVDLWSDHGFVEIRAGYSLRRDHKLRTFSVKVEANAGQTDTGQQGRRELSWRPPSINKVRDKVVARLKRLLAEFDAIPAHRREDELADIRVKSVRVMLKDLERKS